MRNAKLWGVQLRYERRRSTAKGRKKLGPKPAQNFVRPKKWIFISSSFDRKIMPTSVPGTLCNMNRSLLWYFRQEKSHRKVIQLLHLFFLSYRNFFWKNNFLPYRIEKISYHIGKNIFEILKTFFEKMKVVHKVSVTSTPCSVFLDSVEKKS